MSDDKFIEWRPPPSTIAATRPGAWRNMPLLLPVSDDDVDRVDPVGERQDPPGREAYIINYEHPEKEILSAEEVAGLLRIPERTVEAMARRGHLPGKKVGKVWRFARKRVMDWIEENPPENGKEDDEGVRGGLHEGRPLARQVPLQGPCGAPTVLQAHDWSRNNRKRG